MIIVIFLVLSVIFLGVASASWKRINGSQIARKAWRRIGLIFGAVGLGLWLMRNRLPDTLSSGGTKAAKTSISSDATLVWDKQIRGDHVTCSLGISRDLWIRWKGW